MKTPYDRTRALLAINPYGTGADYSGPSTYLSRLLTHIHGSGAWHITLLHAQKLQSQPPFADAATAAPVAMVHYGALAQLGWFVWSFLYVLMFAHRFDVVHIHSCYLFNLGGALAAHLRRTPYTLLPVAEDGDLSGRNSQGPILRNIRTTAVRHARWLFALTDAIALDAVHLGCPRAHVLALPTTVDTEEFLPPTPTEQGTDPRHGLHTAAFIGFLGRQKRPEWLLEALALLRADGMKARAIFAGPFRGEQYEQRFLRFLENARLGRQVTLLGFTESVAQVVCQDADLFVLPSRQEGFPSALVEALAAGLPVVCTDAGAMGHVVRASQAGIVVDSAEAMAEAMKTLWTDDDLWRASSRNGRQYAEKRFSISEVGDQFLACLAVAAGPPRT